MKSFRFYILSIVVFAGCSSVKEEQPALLDDVMMQAFYWDVPVDEQAKDGSWWDHLSEIAPELKSAGISCLWTPVPAKGNWGIMDSGYGIYDHYDLGNYDQKGSVETRYGSRSELHQTIRQLIDIRRQYLGGKLAVLTETGSPEPADITRHVYVARRQGNGTKDGAVVMLNNHDTETLSVTLSVNADGFTDWSGQTLVNLLHRQQTATVSSDGRVTLSAPLRGYSIWVLERDASSPVTNK